MEEIINQVISIDNEAKAIISEMESKEENLENYIEEEINLRQSKIEEEMRNIVNEKQKDYDYELKKRTKIIEEKLSRELNWLDENYKLQKDMMLEDAFKEIIN